MPTLPAPDASCSVTARSNSAVATRTPPAAPSHHATFAVLSAGVVSFGLLQSLVMPVLPTIETALHASATSATWVLTAYLISASIFTPIMGRIGDMVGKKRIFLAATAALGLGSLISALASDIGVLISARALQGIGGGTLPLAFGIVRDEFPHDRVTGAVGRLAALTGFGAGLGTVLAGPIVDLLDFHWLFWFPAIFIALASIAALFLVPESRNRAAGRISPLPALLLCGSLVTLLIAVSEASTWGWMSTPVLCLLGSAVLLGIGWLGAELRAHAPLIDMRMMRIPAVWTANVVALLVGVGMYSTFAFVPVFVQTDPSAGYGFGASVTVSGLIMIPNSIAGFLMGMFSGWLIRRAGSKAVVVGACAIALASMLMLTFAHGSTLDITLANAVMGVGFGLAFSAMSSLVVEGVPQDQTGVASGMNANIRTIGGAIGAALMSSIVGSSAHDSGLPTESGYIHGFIMLAIAELLAVAAALCIPGRKRRRGPATKGDMPTGTWRWPSAARSSAMRLSRLVLLCPESIRSLSSGPTQGYWRLNQPVVSDTV